MARQLDLDQFRQRLEAMRDETRADIARLDQEAMIDSQTEGYGVKNHPAEDATDVFDRERNLAVENEMQRELDQIERALARIADGTYGICEIGGEEIPVERLEARPAATLCIKHQEERDARGLDFNESRV